MAAQGPSILIVDDQPKDLALVEQSLIPLGFGLSTLQDPHQVLRRVEAERPDLVILDALLPGLSGFDLCKQLKSTPEGKNTVVIILTGVYLKDQIRREAIQQFKADAFVTKPYRPMELQRLVLKLLSKKLKTSPSDLRDRGKGTGEALSSSEPKSIEGGGTRWRRWWTALFGRLGAWPGRDAEALEQRTEDGKEGLETRDARAGHDGAGAPDASAAQAREDVDAEATRAGAPPQHQEPSRPAMEPAVEGESGSAQSRPDRRRSSLEAEAAGASETEEWTSKGEVVETKPSGAAPESRRGPRGIPIYAETEFDLELDRELSKCRRLCRPLAVILVRIEDLDQILELFGGDFRDEVLAHVAEKALESLREIDIAGQLSSKEMIALVAFGSGRYGGGRIVARVRRAVNRDPLNVSAAIPGIVPILRFGVAVYPDDAGDAQSLLERAEAVLMGSENSPP